MRHTITIIGTHPPCPRCDLLTRLFTDKIAALGIDADIIHYGFKDPEAISYATTLGLVPGSSGVVAGKLSLTMDNSKQLEPDEDSEYNQEFGKFAILSGWSYELDERLRPLESKARELGILMTPAIVIDNELKHAGSVPRLAVIEAWLNQLKSQ